MTRQLGIALAIVAWVLGCGTAAASLDVADQATLAKHVLTEDELNRMIALTKDAKGRNHGPSVDMSDVGSLEALAAKADKQPGAHALLAAHGFTAREYLVAVLTTARTVMAARMGGGAGTPNVAFYRAHQAQMDRMMNLMSGSDGETTAGNDEDLSGLNVKMLGECTKVTLGTAPLASLPPRNVLDSAAPFHEALANTLAKFASKVGPQNLKDDFRDLSDEIRRQAAAPKFIPTPRFSRALDDLKSWLQNNCSKEAMKK
jgi:hypothetical protein